MPSTETSLNPQAAVLNRQIAFGRAAASANLDGISNEDGLFQPEPGGNCINWNVGHMVYGVEWMLLQLGGETVRPEGTFDRYKRGSDPITFGSLDAIPLAELVEVWLEGTRRLEQVIAELPADRFESLEDLRRNGKPEKVRDYLAAQIIHQGYHAGQIAVLRRLLGREGAIR